MAKKMNPSLRRALERAFTLKDDEGRSWPEIMEILNREGFTDSRGNPFKASNLRSHYSKKRVEIMRDRAEGQERSPGTESPSVQVERSDQEERIAGLPPGWEDRVREIVRAEIRNVMNIQAAEPATEDMPPEPTRTGRGENRQYVKISLTLDKNLWDLFQLERDRLRVSSGRMLDILLWRALGKPRLSYEPDESFPAPEDIDRA